MIGQNTPKTFEEFKNKFNIVDEMVELVSARAWFVALGYFAISNIDGESVHDSVNVKKNTERIQARKTILIEEQQFLLALKNQVSLPKERR